MNNHIPTAGALAELDDDNQAWVIKKSIEVKSIYDDGVRDMVAHFDAQGFGDEELIAIWSLLPSWVKTAYKRHKEVKFDPLQDL